MRRSAGWGAVLGAGLLVIGAALSHAEVPRTIQYQGRLTEPDGSPLTGEQVLTLRLYDAATKGAKVWEEQHEVALVAADNGVFAVILGSRTPFGPEITFTEPLWLTIEVGADGEFSPRQPLSAVGYAINADRLDGLDSVELIARASGGVVDRVQAGIGLRGSAAAGIATLDVGAGAGIVAGADTVSVDVGTTAGKIVQLDEQGALPAVSGANLTHLPVTGGSVGTAALEDGAVTAPKLAGDSVGAAALAAGAIQLGDIEPGDLPAHVHGGVSTIAVSGQPGLTGDPRLAAGSNVTLSQAGQTITIAASGAGAAGARDSAGATNTLAIGTGADTTLATVTITKTQAASRLLVIASAQLAHTANPNDKTVTLRLFRDAAQLDADYAARIGTANRTISDLPVSLHGWDAPGAGTYTYSLRARSTGAGAQATVRRLSVIELP